MENQRPPVDFDHYKNWIRRTREGRLWWLATVSEHHVRYVCGREECNGIVWYTKGEALPETLHCGDCRYGLMRQSVPQELKDLDFWRKGEEAEKAAEMSAARRVSG